MKRKLLAVMPDSINYVNYYDVYVAHSFEDAKIMIQQAEMENTPFDDLDLPVADRSAFEAFLNWMITTNRRYAFSIFGYRSSFEFMRIRDYARRLGFHFND